MTLIAAFPIVGILFFFYSVTEGISAGGYITKCFQPLVRRFPILRFSSYDRVFFSFALGLYLIYFSSNHSAAFLRLLWSLGIFGFVFLMITEYRARRSLNLIFFLFIFGVPLSTVFDFFGPATALNFDDDLAKYLVLPIGLIHNGGLDFGPLGPQMGGASFLAAGLQALYLFGADVEWIAHWDIAASLALIITFIAVPGAHLMRGRRRSLVAGISLIFGVFLVNVMYVNISAIYLPATIFALLGGLLVVSGRPSFWEAVGVGGVAATFYLFKQNYILFSATMLVGYSVGVGLWPRISIKDKAILVGACVVVFSLVAPDALFRSFNIFNSVFFRFSHAFSSDDAGRISGNSENESSTPLGAVDSMFNLEPTFYGYGVDSYFSINFFVVLISLVSMLGLSFIAFEFLKKGRPVRQCAVGIVLIASLSSLILGAQYYLFSHSMGAVDANIRYMMPSILGLVLFAICSWWFVFPKEQRLLHTLLICIIIAFLGSQVTSSGHRLFQALKYGNLLAFPAAREQFMAVQTDFVVGKKGLKLVTELQSLLPEQATILAAVGFPSLFDFQRNRVLLAEADGELELFDDPKKFLKNNSVDFIFWQTRGLGVRTVQQWKAWGNSSPARARFAKERIVFLEKLNSLLGVCDSITPIDQIVIIPVASCAFSGG